MKVVAIDENSNYVKVLKTVPEYPYLDKFNRKTITKYQINKDNYILWDNKRKKQQKCIPNIIYNFPNVLNAVKENKYVVFCENERMCEYFKAVTKSDKYIYSTFLKSIDDNISDKTLQLLTCANVFIICYEKDKHSTFEDRLLDVTGNVKQLSIKDDENNLSREEKYIFNRLKKFHLDMEKNN